jgi:hypothetical protein
MVKTLSLQDFAPYRNTMFHIAEAPGYEFGLAELSDHSTSQLEQFSLVFTCPALPWLPQGTYTFAHADMGELALFIVPIGPADGAMRYESVFSRFVRASSMATQD